MDVPRVALTSSPPITHVLSHAIFGWLDTHPHPPTLELSHFAHVLPDRGANRSSPESGLFFMMVLARKRMKVTGFRNLLPLVTKLLSTVVLCAGGFTQYGCAWVPLSEMVHVVRHQISVRSSIPSWSAASVWPCMAINRQETCHRCVVHRAAVFALHPAPLSLCLPGRRKAQPRRLGEAERASREVPGFSHSYSGRIAWTGEGFPALLTQRPHLMSCPFNAVNVCNASSTNIGAIPFR